MAGGHRLPSVPSIRPEAQKEPDRRIAHRALGEGRVGGPTKYETYILLANPGATAATVKVTYLREGGLPPIVPAPIVVERAMYSNGTSRPSVFWAAGTNATATPIP